MTSSAGIARFLALTGPTSVGKTGLSLAVASAMGGEIISMDSRQIYRGMDVATDKVSLAARARVRHHGLDLLEPDEAYSAGRFARDARRWIGEIAERGRVPMLVGGTAFFLRALMDPMFEEPAIDRERLDRIRTVLSGWGREELERWVLALDPERAAVAFDGGPHRLMRAIEVPLLTGRRLSFWYRNATATSAGVPGLVVVLMIPREELYQRINVRVDRMVRDGLLEEVNRLLEAGYRREHPGMTGTGYREIAAHLAGEISLEEAKDEMRRVTRRYARRQLNWFRNQLPEDHVVLDATRPAEELVDDIRKAWTAVAGVAGVPGVPGVSA